MANITTKTVAHHAITLDLAALNAFEQRARQATTIGGIFCNGTLAVLEDRHDELVANVAKLKGQDCEPAELHELLRLASNYGPEEFSSPRAAKQWTEAKGYADRGMPSHALICFWQSIECHNSDAEMQEPKPQLKGTLVDPPLSYLKGTALNKRKKVW